MAKILQKILYPFTGTMEALSEVLLRIRFCWPENLTGQAITRFEELCANHNYLIGQQNRGPHIVRLNAYKIFIALIGILATLNQAYAEELLCARVRIEIQQELAFERQAFNARMRILNSLTDISLTDVSITVWIKNEAGELIPITSDPNNTSALFFIRVDSLSNINDTSGNGTIQPSTDAEINWLLIPTVGASGGTITGKLYYVGATLSYKLSGEVQEIEVSPDVITVKPQPELELDYFLTRDVRADDPTTTEIEPSEPFTLGVRITNSGHGIGRNVSIDSAQPKIVDNDLGLLIGFRINESSVNDQPTSPTLLLNFGNLGVGESKVGRWLMETSLAGKFVSFSAQFVHSNELGGELTSLLTRTSAHLLIHDVLVDLPGRDSIRDFLAHDDALVNLYESDGVDSPVTDYSDVASFNYENESNGVQVYRAEFPRTSGASYMSLLDPTHGGKEIVKAVREDGKVLSLDNAWFSVSGVGNEVQYFVNLFDVNGGGSYQVSIQDKSLGPKPPVIQFIPDRTTMEGQQISFLVEASDPNGTIPTITIDLKPRGATFVDRGNGTAIFDWHPVVGQKGRYPLTFRASDGVLSSARSATVRVLMLGDSDGDDMLDSWEMFYFGTFERDGTGDFDGDGVSDKAEYDRDSDPTFAGDIPSVPIISSPLDATEVQVLQPTLKVHNSIHGKKAATYDFELYSDINLTTLVASKLAVSEGNSETSWTMPQSLSDNMHYYWRARAATNFAISEWVRGSFFVNTTNDPPGVFYINQPSNGSVVASLTPILSVTNSSDVDGDVLTYGFEVHQGRADGPLVTSVNNIAQNSSGVTSWQIPVTLSEDEMYFWRVTATDEHGLSTSTFWASFVPSLENNSPSIPIPLKPLFGDVVTANSVDLVSKPSIDPEAQLLQYKFELDIVNTFDSPNLVSSGFISESNGEVRFTVSNLLEDRNYFWRVKAFDGLTESGWATSGFFVNVYNHAPSTPTVDNPGMGAWVPVLRPSLVLNNSIDPDNEPLKYQFEIYADAALMTKLHAVTLNTTIWNLETPLQDNTRYYWRARAVDPLGLASEWTAVFNFFVNKDNINDPPTFEFIEPNSKSVSQGGNVLIRWSDADTDSNAKILLYANDQLIASGISEDPDGEEDTFNWNIAGLVPGQYQLRAVIADELSSVPVMGPVVTIVNTEQVPKDSDGDGIPDSRDNCPYFANSNQKDSGGLLLRKKDLIGNACQCGDVNGDGIVDKKDSDLIRKAMKKGSKVKMKRLDLCNVGSSKACNVQDAVIIEQVIKKMQQYQAAKKKKGAMPRLRQLCGPANK